MTGSRSVMAAAAAALFVLGTGAVPPQSPEITKRNVAQLQPAWTYRTGETSALRHGQADGVRGDAAGGRRHDVSSARRSGGSSRSTRRRARERWMFDPKIARDVTLRRFREPRRLDLADDRRAPTRAPCRRRIFVATAQSHSSRSTRATARPARASAPTASWT